MSFIEFVTHIFMPYIFPPILGAIIGYITNDIAIKMLFRPLREYRILGLRVPFTPGIIPRERFKLAQNIGEMVSNDLLNWETLHEKVVSDDFKHDLKEQIRRIIANLMSTPISELKSGLEGIIVNGSREYGRGLIRKTLQSSFLGDFIRRSVGNAVRSFFEQDVRTLNERLHADELLVDRIMPWIFSKEPDESVLSWLNTWVETATNKSAEGKGSVLDILPDETIELFTILLDSFYESLFGALFDWLRSDEMQKELKERGRLFLKDVIGQLNLIQKILVSAAQYDKTLHEKMPEIIADFLERLEQGGRSSYTRLSLLESFSGGLKDWRSKGLGILGDKKVERFKLLLQTVVRGLGRFFDSEEIRDGIKKRIGSFIEENGDKALHEVSGISLGEQANEVSDFLSRVLLDLIQDEATAESLAVDGGGLIDVFFTDNRDKTIRDLLGASPDQDEPLLDTITERLLVLMDTNIAPMLQGINIQKLVEDRINGLDILSVEKILILVIARQLKWINVFGAILGALIGGIQVLFGLLF